MPKFCRNAGKTDTENPEKHLSVKMFPDLSPMTGEDLKIWRDRNGYATQESLRQELGVTRDTISRWERSKESLPRQLQLALLALAELPQCRNIWSAHREADVGRTVVKS